LTAPRVRLSGQVVSTEKDNSAVSNESTNCFQRLDSITSFETFGKETQTEVGGSVRLASSLR